MSSPDPMAIPEILACIAKFLTRGQTATCMRVCKAWTPEFERATWRSVECTNDPRAALPQPSLELVKRNAHQIRHLVYKVFEDESVPASMLRCPHLETVRFETYDGDPWDVLAEMIENLPSLYKIVIQDCGATSTVSKKFLSAITTCPTLVVLETSGIMIYEETEQYLRAIAPRMRRVATQDDSFLFYQAQWTDDLLFSELRYLDLRAAMCLEGELEWIVRCPNLISLGWESPDIVMPIKEFCSRVPVACPNLTCFELLLSISDGDIALILNAIPRIEKFTVARSNFGPQSIVALRRHFPTLKDFNIQYNMSASSKIVQEVLSSCPNLLSLCADEIEYEDLIQQPWICRSLRLLDVGFRAGEANAHQKEVYRKLAELTELEWLSIGSPDLEIEGGQMDLTLEAGLDALKTLTKLENFHGKGVLERAVENQGYQTVGWMLENWPRLKTLEGYIPEFHPSYDQIASALEERGIKYVEDNDDEEEEEFDSEYDEYFGEGFDDFDEFDDYDSDDGYIPGRPYRFDFRVDLGGPDDDDDEDEWTDE
ncbi:hypothetical protein EMPS_01044 [Entomortierella parvispora]|uniref:F-box domain-containing protein n=1 Tax=Entomortierella parvispora TaxID=205924 RepID=A0A9P3H2T4_9FUNG|nr:hypothetical protein EMPS_01044 [Entomortierella parvispora]